LYVTYREAAKVCRLSESMVRKLVKAGVLRATKFGKSARISVRQLEDFDRVHGGNPR
jgi:DNA binding domain, excisionase family